MGVIYFDTETTGFNPGQIGQLSLILEDSGQVKLAKNYFFQVDSMEPDASAVTGLTVEGLKELSGGATFKDSAEELFSLMSQHTIVAHNLPFDEKFLSMEFWRLGKSFKPLQRFDSMRYFTDICKLPNPRKYGTYKFPKLSELADYLNISLPKVAAYTGQLFNADCRALHDARVDTTLLAVCCIVYREKLSGGSAWQSVFCNS